MSESPIEAEKVFRCPACSAAFRWKPHYAQRQVRCRCGHAFVAPASVGADDAMYDIEAEPPATARASAQPARVAPPVAAQSDPARPASSSAVVSSYAYLARRRQVAQEAETNAPSIMRDIYVPAVLLPVGLALRFGQLFVFREMPGNQWGGPHPGPGGIAAAIGLVACELIVNLGIMLGGTALATRLLDSDFVSLGRAVFKLAAVAVFAAGVGSMIALLDRGRNSVSGLVLAWHAIIVIYWIAFTWLFSLELQETMLTVAIIGILQAILFLGLWGMR